MGQIREIEKQQSLFWLGDTFDLTNLIKANTCFKSSNQTSIDVLLKNRPKSFQKPGVIITGLKDCHKMILTFSRSHYQKLELIEVLDILKLKISHTNWKKRYAPKNVMEGLNMIT